MIGYGEGNDLWLNGACSVVTDVHLWTVCTFESGRSGRVM